MQPIPCQKVIFDLDGTLVDTAPDLLRATNHVLTAVGRTPVSLQQVRHMVGFGAMRLMELGLEATGGVKDIIIADMLPIFLDYYAQNIAIDSQPFSGAEEVLISLKTKGYSLGICTNKPHKLAINLLHELDLDKYFECIIGGDSLSEKKPHPRPILHTATLLSGNGRAVMVGDSMADINGAKAANIPSILVTFGYSAVPHKELGADRIITALAALPACLTLDATE